MNIENELSHENQKLKQLRVIVDLVAGMLREGNLSDEQATELISATKRHVLTLFPGKEATYNLIYGSRFKRILEEHRARKIK